MQSRTVVHTHKHTRGVLCDDAVRFHQTEWKRLGKETSVLSNTIRRNSFVFLVRENLQKGCYMKSPDSMQTAAQKQTKSVLMVKVIFKQHKTER